MFRISSRAISQAQANAAASSLNTAARSGLVSVSPARIAKKYCGMAIATINFERTVERFCDSATTVARQGEPLGNRERTTCISQFS
jgi:hypothetical protein